MSYYAPQTPQHGPQAPMTPQPGSSPGGSPYPQYYQQPQNIYQQLGQAQPQPHLQRLYQQQSQYQQPPPPQPGGYAQPPVQSHGFIQRPVSTGFQPPHQGYANPPPPHSPFQQPPQQQQYTQQQQYQPSQYNNALQQPPRPLSRAPSATGFVPTNSYATPGSGYMNQTPMQLPPQEPPQQPMSYPSSSLLSQQMQQLQRRTPQPPQQGYGQEPTKPPPVSPSALLAQQVHARRPTHPPNPIAQPLPPPSQQASSQIHMRQQPPPPNQPPQHVQMQPRQHPLQQQPPQLPPGQQQQQQANGRRPLPQPAPDSSSPSNNPTSPPTTGLGLMRSGTIASRSMSMPPTSTGRIAPISTASAALAAFNQERQSAFGGQQPQPQSQFGQQPAQSGFQPSVGSGSVPQTPMSASTIPPPSFVQRQIQQIQQMQAQQAQSRNLGSNPNPSAMGVQQQQQQQMESSMSEGNGSSAPARPPSASPTKRRPLPAAPGSGGVGPGAVPAKRATIDLGKVSGLPIPNTGSAFAFNGTPSSVGSNSSSVGEGSGTGYFEGEHAPQEGGPSSQQRFPPLSSSVPSSSGMGMGVSRTTSMAAGHHPSSSMFSTPSKGGNATNTALGALQQDNNDDTPKRRASPPKFSASSSGPNSNSSSPKKEPLDLASWGLSNSGKPPHNPFNRSQTNLSTPDLTSSSSKPTSTPSSPGSSNSHNNTNTATTPTKKFTPVWKRTIPDYPAPVFGYAAGMVADPFAKPPTSASPNKTAGPDTTPKAKPSTSAPTEKERKKAEKDEKKRAKEEEKARKKAAKMGVALPGMQQGATASPTPSTASSSTAGHAGGSPGGSMLPYLQGTPPGKSKAYAHGQFQHQHMMMRGAVVGQQQPQQQTTPTTRQIQVRGQPVSASQPPQPPQQLPQQQQGYQPTGVVARYTQPLQPQSSTSEESTGDDEEDTSEDGEEEDPQKAYEYEGSDYTSTSEPEYAAAPAPVQQPRHGKGRDTGTVRDSSRPADAKGKRARSKPRSAREMQEEEDRLYQEYLEQRRARKVAGRRGKYHPEDDEEDDDEDEDEDEEEEEEEERDQRKRPSPSPRHVKTRSSASDGFVVVHQSTSPSGGHSSAHKKTASAASSGRSSAHSHSRGQSHHTYSNSESDGWEQLQAYEASPRKTTPRGKGRRYDEPPSSEEQDEDEDDEDAEEMRRRHEYDEKKRRAGSSHRREVSERETVRRYAVRDREQEYEGYSHDTPRAKKGTPTKAAQGKGVRERVQDIDWSRGQQQQQHGAKQYKQPLKYQQDEEEEEDEEDDRGRQTKKKSAASKKAGSKTNFVKEILTRSRSRSKHRYTEPEDEEEDEDESPYARKHSRGGKSESESPTKPGRKLVKKKHMSSGPASETESQDDGESIATTNTQTSAAGRLVSKFTAKFTGGQQKQQAQAVPASSQGGGQQQKRQSGFTPPQQGFSKQPSKALFFGISDTPPPSAGISSQDTGRSSQQQQQQQASSSGSGPSSSRMMVRGEVNRTKVGLKVDSLDDPPPRSLRTPSPSPGGSNTRPQSMHAYSSQPQSQLRQQQQQQQQQSNSFQAPRRPQSQVYGSAPRSSFMDDIPPRSNHMLQSQEYQRPAPPHQQPQQQPQQPMSFDPTTGLPVHHQQTMQGYAPPQQPSSLSRPPSQRQLAQQHQQQAQQQAQQHQQQYGGGIPSAPSTPRQQHQQPINIESPAPLKMADILKMEQDGMAHEQRQEEQNLRRQQSQRQQQQQQQYQNQTSSSIPSINVASPPESVVSSPPPPMINIHHTGGTAMSSGTQRSSPMIPMINFDPVPPTPMISVSEAGPPSGGASGGGQAPPSIQVFEIPGVSVSGPEFDEFPSGKQSGPQISVNGGRPQQQQQQHNHVHGHQPQQARFVNAGGQSGRPTPARSGTGGLICGGCQGPIVGRIVSAMGVRWHPGCFKCSVCNENLEHVSSYEHDGRPYCHLDYHENFAPRCYSCKTPIIEEQFISLDDPALGKRTYHMEHFFCAECGDPFLTPSMSNQAGGGELALSGDGDFEGFTVYKGHPYCEACHVRLRLPKCKKCRKSIRDHDRAVEALGGKWCWACFVCDGCEQPFEDPSFFQRDNRPYCENCFSIILRNEI